MWDSTWEPRFLPTTPSRWCWLQNNCTSSMPLYGRQPLQPCTYVHWRPSPQPEPQYFDTTLIPSAHVLPCSWYPMDAHILTTCIQVAPAEAKAVCVSRYLVSVMETFLLYQHFRPTPEPSGGPLLRAHFWLHFLLQSCQPFKADPPQEDQCLVRAVGPRDPGTRHAHYDRSLSPTAYRYWYWR